MTIGEVKSLWTPSVASADLNQSLCGSPRELWLGELFFLSTGMTIIKAIYKVQLYVMHIKSDKTVNSIPSESL